MTWSTESRHARGYGKEWDRLRLVILKRDGWLCQCDECGGKDGGRVTIAGEVNHKTSKAEAKRLGWTREQIDDPSNLHAINSECHKRVTAEQAGKTLKPKGHDINGFPTSHLHPWNTAGGRG